MLFLCLHATVQIILNSKTLFYSKNCSKSRKFLKNTHVGAFDKSVFEDDISPCNLLQVCLLNSNSCFYKTSQCYLHYSDYAQTKFEIKKKLQLWNIVTKLTLEGPLSVTHLRRGATLVVLCMICICRVSLL